MATLSTSALDVSQSARPFSLQSALLDYWALTKPEVNFLIVIATFTGFYFGYPRELHNFPWGRVLNTLFGTLLVASGTGTLNQYLEYRFDAQMRRTRRRPVAAGRVRPAAAACFGVLLSLIGGVYLLVAVNPLASALALFTLTTYLLVYTPLKRKTPLCTLVGAFPGAMPPLIGWAAASGSITSGKAWTLYALLFLWQFPHFMAIAWMYREDYARAGYCVLPANHEQVFLGWVTAISSIALFGLAAVPEIEHGTFQYSGALVLTSVLLFYSVKLPVLRSRIAARQLLTATIIYLPLEFLLLVVGKG
jgi:protoheme IX farnesyltransferase